MSLKNKLSLHPKWLWGESGCPGEPVFIIVRGCEHGGNICEVFVAENKKAVFLSLKISLIPLGYGVQNFAGRRRYQILFKLLGLL